MLSEMTNYRNYHQLFRNGVPWRQEETRCISKGDDFCEIVVEAA